MQQVRLLEGQRENGTSSKKRSLRQQKQSLTSKKRHHQDWFDENNEVIQALLKEIRDAYINWQNHPSCVPPREWFKECKVKAQRGIDAMQDAWWVKKADEVLLYAMNNSKQLFNTIKAIYGSSSRGLAPLLSVVGSTIIKDKGCLSARPNSPKIDPPAANQANLDPTPANRRRAPGGNGIPSELFTSLGSTAVNTFPDILSTIWDQEDIPTNLRDTTGLIKCQ
uniref:Uncharacterized protein n=1 Tax=Octopus bimaculoides TaxID=37653 RepID=A0A0L8GF71_OCTBM